METDKNLKPKEVICAMRFLFPKIKIRHGYIAYPKLAFESLINKIKHR